jgi:hypothetical protein
MQILSGIIFALFLIFNSVTVDAQVQVRVKFNEIANLTYQLDCVGDLPVNCSRGNLGELWKREFLKTNQDREMLKEWARLRDRYNKTVELTEKNGEKSYLSMFDKIRIAGFQANSVDDYVSLLDLLTNPSDRLSFERVIRYFQPKFNVWWKLETVKCGDGFTKQTDVLLRSPKISQQIKQFYNFYSPELPADYEISFNLFYIPDFVKESSGGQQLQNYSLMEFKPKEKPEQRIDVVVHELCHFFFENMKSSDKARLAQNFYSTNRAAAIPAFNLLNETLAAAFGNGMIARTVTPKEKFEQYVAAKQSFYNNDAIDRAAKASLSMLDRWLENEKSIADADFVNQYITVLERAFGEDLIKPKLYLSELFLFVDGDYKSNGSLRRGTRKTLEVASFYNVEGTFKEENLAEFRNNARLNSLFIIHPNNIKELAANKIISETEANQIQKEFDAKREVLFNKERAPFTYVYIVAAKDVAGAIKMVEKLTNAKQFFGVYKEQI